MVGPLASPAFRPHFLGPWAENQISFFQIALLFPKGITQSPCPKTLEGDRFGRNPPFSGPRPDPGGSGVKITCPKITCEELSGP